MAEASVHIEEFTDPACPWAYSAEPFRRRLDWLYEGSIAWTPRMVVLSSTADENAERGFTPERLSEGYKRIAHEHHMPIDTRERSRVAASRDACSAVVATRTRADHDSTRRVLRSLRVRNFSGQLLDDPETIAGAAVDAGLDPAELRSWMEDAEVASELERDMADARRPSPAARVLDHKLANWSGGRRYTCPSYEITRLSDGVRIAVPGFQPFAVYDAILANLVPGLERREPEPTPAEVLGWAAVPLATQEVAVLCDIDFEEAREALGRVAVQDCVGADGFWKLNGAS